MLAGTASPLDPSRLYRYAAIAPLVLPVGIGYTVGSFDTGSQDNVFYYGGPTAAAGVTFVSGAYSGSASFDRPTISVSFTAANFVIAPEPTSALLLVAGALVVGLRRQRREGQADSSPNSQRGCAWLLKLKLISRV